MHYQLFNKHVFSVAVMFVLFIRQGIAGPPFLTDDPVPVPYKHWEFYISSINTIQQDEWTGTSPHFETNYGLLRNMQVHLLVPLNYSYIPGQQTSFGYGDTELGVKYRFLDETDKRPQVGIFPIVEIPTVKNDEFTDGKVKVYIPVWVQKSWNRLTTYGGAGYWFNPGDGNKNFVFVGWELEYEISRVVTLGGETYFQGADRVDGKPSTAFNIGGSINPDQKTHVIFSLGHSITGQNIFTSYLGLLLTI